MRCLTHRLGFTLYPPGHVPYGRVAVAAVAPDGRAVVEAGPEVPAGTATLFDAALDAAQGTAWARQSSGGTAKWWGTQGRHIEIGVGVCGVAPALGAAAQQAHAAALRVEQLLLMEQTRAIVAAPGYRSRGKAVAAVFERVAAGPCVLERVLAAGHLAGLWGLPLAWEPAVRRLRPLSFRGDGTRPP
jgi:hypothetical protein